MSAKDAFFKKMKENSSSKEELRSKVKTDKDFYRGAIFDLTKLFETWLHGSGVKVTTTDNNFSDETILTRQGCEDLSAYQVHVCTIENGENIAFLTPEGIYGERGAKGWASLTINTPSRAPRTLKLTLRLADNGTWTISPDDNVASVYASPIREEMPLTEEVFFQAIQSLA